MRQKDLPSALLALREEENQLQALAEELNKSGTESMIITADLSEKEACYRLMQQLEPVPVGILINNAGFGDCGSFLETDADKEMQMIDVNVKAMHLLMKLMLRRMEKQEGGYILNVASSAGLLPAGPYMATYYATKAYMASLTRAVALELKQRGSRHSGWYFGDSKSKLIAMHPDVSVWNCLKH